MKYNALAREWRPKTFLEVIGQEHITISLRNTLKNKQIHHAYLFSGSHGIGKTSIARLFAKGLNCKNGITEFPCNKCVSCKSINYCQSLDLIEIDAASKTKIEDTRILLDNVQYSPISDRFKIYLIDEVHMLSRSSFNALLKTLEEPPQHVKFLLATTNPEKIPKTIISRCIHFYLKIIHVKHIKNQIQKILVSKKIQHDELSCKLIANASKGSMRDGLSLLDQAIAFCDKKVFLKSVKKMLEILDTEEVLKIIRAIIQQNGNKIMKSINKIYEKGIDVEKILTKMLSIFHKMIIIKTLSLKKENCLDLGFQKELYLLSDVMKTIELHFYYKLLLIGRKELKYSPSKRIGVEITLLKILFFQKNSTKNKLDYTLKKYRKFINSKC